MKKGPIQAIEALVASVADSAAQGGVRVRERIEALRVLAPYYVALKKNKITSIPEEAGGDTINDLQDAVRQLESGNGQAVSNHQRRRRRPAPTVEN